MPQLISSYPVIRCDYDPGQDISHYELLRAKGRPVLASDPVIAYIPQRTESFPVVVEDEWLQRLNSTTFRFRHQHILEAELFLEEETLSTETYHIESKLGLITTNEPIEGGLRADYTFDGLVVVDHTDLEQLQSDVEYRGPTLTDEDLMISAADILGSEYAFDEQLLTLWITPNASSESVIHYGLRAVKHTGAASAVHPVAAISSDAIAKPVEYVVERRYPGTSWEEVDTTDDLVWSEPFSVTLSPCNIVSVEYTPLDRPDSSEVRLSWTLEFPDPPILPEYRLRTQWAQGEAGPSSVHQPVYYPSQDYTLHVWRKVYDETPPTETDWLLTTEEPKTGWIQQTLEPGVLYHYGFVVETDDAVSDPYFLTCSLPEGEEEEADE